LKALSLLRSSVWYRLTSKKSCVPSFRFRATRLFF
jgi:hypothetical protein